MLACIRLALHEGKDMNVIEVGDTFNCDCGFSWKRGQSGSHNCGDGLRKQIAELQQKLDALAAENAALKDYLKECAVVQGEGNWTSDANEFVYVPAVKWMPPTPATDALRNAVRAEAIEHAAEKGPWLYGDQMGRSVEAIPKEQLIKWAAQLRAETDTTSSQYESLAGGK